MTSPATDHNAKPTAAQTRTTATTIAIWIGPRITPAAGDATDARDPGAGMADPLTRSAHVEFNVSNVSSSMRSSATAAIVASSSAAAAATRSAALATEADISVAAHVPLKPALA